MGCGLSKVGEKVFSTHTPALKKEETVMVMAVDLR